VTIAVCYVVCSKSETAVLHTISFQFHFIQLEEAKKKANQVTKSSEDLSNHIKQARDELETNLQDTRNIVKDLRDFLSGMSRFT